MVNSHGDSCKILVVNFEVLVKAIVLALWEDKKCGITLEMENNEIIIIFLKNCCSISADMTRASQKLQVSWAPGKDSDKGTIGSVLQSQLLHHLPCYISGGVIVGLRIISQSCPVASAAGAPGHDAGLPLHQQVVSWGFSTPCSESQSAGWCCLYVQL